MRTTQEHMSTTQMVKFAFGLAAAVLAACALVAPASAQASTAYTFVGATGGGDDTSWGDAKNWSPEGVPGDGDAVTILDDRVGEMPTVTLTRLQLAPEFGPNGSLSGDGTLTLSEGLDWTGGGIGVDVTLPAGTSSTIDAQTSMGLNAHMRLAGTSDWSGAVRLDTHTGAITNTGRINADASVHWHGATCCGVAARFVNDGTIAVAGAGTTKTSAMHFANNGTIDTAAGSTFEVATLGALRAGSDMTGAGRVLVTGHVGVTLEGQVTVAAGATLELAAPGVLTGNDGVLSGAGRVVWTGGQMAGATTVSSATSLVVSGSQEKQLVGDRARGTGILRLAGPTSMSGSGALRILASGAITNTGTFTAEPGSVVTGNTCCSNPAEFRNEGTVAVPRAGTATFAFLTFEHRRDITIAGGATLRLQGPAAHVFGPGATLGGTGTTLLTNGARLNGDVDLLSGATLELSLGALVGKGTLKGSGRFVWSGGDVQGPVTVADPIATSIVGTTTKDVRRSLETGAGLLNLHGPTDLSGTGAVFLHDSSLLANRGTLTMRPGTRIGGSGCCAAFDNEGTLLMTEPAGPTAPAAAQITGMPFVNSGAIKLTGAGSTLSTDRYTQPGGGRLETVIAGSSAGNGYSQLRVGAAAALDGDLVVRKAPTFTPAAGQVFNTIASGSRSGAFAYVAAPGLTIQYVPTGVNMVVPAAPARSTTGESNGTDPKPKANRGARRP